MRFKLIHLLSLLLLVSCSTYPHSQGREEYVKKIDQLSAGDKQFAGLYHNFEFRATLLTRDITRAIHDRLKLYYAWSDQDSSQKLTKKMAQLNSKTKLWLSFFTPERKNDNLANKVSIWKIYLVAGSQRYEGKATKANKNFSEATALFHYHNRWATPYYVEFPVPTDDIQGLPTRLIITGPLGRREVSFPTVAH